mmetsp:Transcript_30070/g.61924  ORF Transcript_30070/g.61924 Transcript_30070/m.61924 type:complete len:129 (-) Transcript_30070:4-390(-)
MHVGRGRAHGQNRKEIEWRCEEAKLHQWRHRLKVGWPEMYEHVKAEAAQAQKEEARGFRMLAWPIVQAISRQARCGLLVGLTALEADPTMQWASASEGCQIEEGDSPLVMLDAVEPERSREVRTERQT